LVVKGWHTTPSLGILRSSRSTLYLNGYLDFFPWPNDPNAEPEEARAGPPRTCLLDDVRYYWNAASPSDVAAAIVDPSVSTLFAKKIIASSWLVLLQYLSGTVYRLETRLWNFEDMNELPSAEVINVEVSNLRFLLSRVTRWRRRIWWYVNHMKSNLEAISQPVGSSEDVIHEDFCSILGSLEWCRDRIDSLMPIVLGATNLLEAQQATQEAKSVSRLTIVALIFAPLSFTTGLFSMSGSFLPG